MSRKAIEKILDHDPRLSVTMWTDGLAMVKEALRTGMTVDGMAMTKEERIKYEEHEVVITNYLHLLRTKIIGLEEEGARIVKSILGWMGEQPDDLSDGIPQDLMRGISARAREVVKIKDAEEREREKFK